MLIKVLLEFLDVAKVVYVSVWLEAFIKKNQAADCTKEQKRCAKRGSYVSWVGIGMWLIA